MKNTYFFLVFLASLVTKANTPNLIFKENRSQWPEKVLFGTEYYNSKVYLTKTGLRYCIYNPSELKKSIINRNQKDGVIHGHVYEVDFLGANYSGSKKENEISEYYNYFLGSDKSKWANNVKACKKVIYNDFYPQTNLIVYSNGANLKYDFELHPGASVQNIKMQYKYVDGLEIENNKLIIKTSVGDITEYEPYSYQIINGKKQEVKCEYAQLDGNTISFKLPNGYNKDFTLIIDPTVIVASYSGSSIYSNATCCTYDAQGNIYSLGYTFGVGYPTSTGAFQINYAGGLSDNVLSVYNSNGSAKLFSTYLGGDDFDESFGIVVENNEIIIIGVTNSTNFPCTTTAFDLTYNGKNDLVISKLNMAGTTLLASTYIGTVADEGLNTLATGGYDRERYGEMVCDTMGNVYVLAATTSSVFPVTSGAISTSLKGIYDAVAFKMDKNLSMLNWSTYLGGNSNENARSIKLDGTGGVYCFGTTNSLNFPTTPGCISSVKGGTGVITDMYIAHINSTGTALIASTYLGTTSADYAAILDIDLNGDIYLSGNLTTPSFLVPTPGTYSNPNGWNAIYKINPSLTAVIYKTRFGNQIFGKDPNLFITAFKVDSCQNIYISGHAGNTLPTTPNAFQLYGGGYSDIYMAVFKKGCSSLQFASFYGGSRDLSGGGEHSDGGINHFDNKGFLYHAVSTTINFPTTANAYEPNTFNNKPDSTMNNDAFLKVDLQTFVKASSSYGANIIGCPPFTPTFVSTTNTGTSYWNLGNGVTSTLNTVSTTYTNLGTYNVLLVGTDTNTCNRTDSIKSILNVITPTAFDLGDDVPTCIGMPALLQSNVSAITYSWSTGQTDPTISVNQIGTYTLTINNGGCNSSDFVNVVIGEKKLSERFPNVITPNGDQVNDFIDFTKYNFEEVEFYVYDRWGRERYKITNASEHWNPYDLDNGTYYYVVNYQSNCTGKHQTDKGFISVFK